jgi:hypothetical protein
VRKRHLNELTLKLDGAINAKIFVNAVKSFFELIQSVSDNATQTKNSIEWVVEVDRGSAIIMAQPSPKNIPPERIPHTVEVIERGLRDLEQGEKKRPEHFTDEAMRSAKILSQLSENDVFVSIRASWETLDQPVTQRLSTQTAASVDSILEASYSDYGAIEGKLETVSARQGYRFNIYDDLTSRSVKCYFEPKMLPDVFEAFEHRVSVWGWVKYRKDGLPVSIEVDNFRVFRKSEELPSVEDIVGILRDTA